MKGRKLDMSITETLVQKFGKVVFTLQEAYNANPKVNHESVRARIYEGLGKKFDKVARGVYRVSEGEQECILMEGDGRDLSFLENESVDAIITDHPWSDKANKGGNRSFSDYECFRYTLDDFVEKARVLKKGSFLVEFLPAENETNYQYLYEIKQMAKEAGFEYYSKVSWKKGTFVGNTGRKAKNTEDVMIFTKGKARSLRPDAKKDKAEPDKKHYMSGTNGMLPTAFDVQPPSKLERLHQAEKPVGLIEQILDFITQENEIVLDQFAGSGAIGEASLNKKRNCILIEKCKENIAKIANRLSQKFANEIQFANAF